MNLGKSRFIRAIPLDDHLDDLDTMALFHKLGPSNPAQETLQTIITLAEQGSDQAMIEQLQAKHHFSMKRAALRSWQS